jgi:hypothetical protein
MSNIVGEGRAAAAVNEVNRINKITVIFKS